MKKEQIKIFNEVLSSIDIDLKKSINEYKETHNKEDTYDVIGSIQEKVKNNQELSEDEKHIQALTLLRKDITQPKSYLRAIAANPVTTLALALFALFLFTAPFLIPDILDILEGKTEYAMPILTIIVGAVVMATSNILNSQPRPSNNVTANIMLEQEDLKQALEKKDKLINFIKNENGLLPKGEIEQGIKTKHGAKDPLESSTFKSRENPEKQTEQPKEQLKSILKKGEEQAKQDKKKVTFSEVTQVSNSIETPAVKK